ncbi:Protein of unknown function [Gillisia sp. Hel1_33_143]|uniref:DUF2004 domain-containing protein n=1 Tax=unclassified Gillisia TaxID=2615025 RepID=UPI0005544B49|nr:MULTISPECIES: DUF2004 domain-containing protein [unclassified Gillisia]SDS27020.1 Protein of unknown function [Gillisia sp. Hel1_33_143]
MGIFDFFKKNKEESENKKAEVLILEKPNFSKVNIEKLEDYYDWTINYGERKLNLDLNFETDSTNQAELNQIMEFVKKIPEFDHQNRNYIKSDFEQDVSMTSDYLNFYLDELDESELGGIIDLKNRKKSRNSLLMEELNLIRVGIYPQASYFATFDYSIDIDGEPCNQLLVLNINQDGTLDYITWES